MKKYFYLINDRQFGPVTKEELKNKIDKDTLVWYEGLREWSKAKDLDELSSMLKPLILEKPQPLGFDLEKKEVESVPKWKQRAARKNTMFSAIFSFNGRIRRMEYGLSLIIYALLRTVLDVATEYGGAALIGLGYIPLLWFLWAQGAKRCHDLGKSGWWQIIPFYVLWLIFQDGEKGINEYGTNAKGEF